MNTTSGLQAPARPAPVPVGDRLLAGGQGDLASLLDRFQPRPQARTWPATRQPREQLLDRLLRAPFRMENTQSQANRKAGAAQLLAWLESLPGETWQERWAASGAEEAADWRALPARWIKGGRRASDDHGPEVSRLGTGLILLVTGDALRPGLPLLLTCTSRHLAAEMARTRDPEGFARLESLCETVPDGPVATRAFRRITAIMAAKGGLVADVTVGDCLEALHLMNSLFDRTSDRNPYFYQLMHATGAFPAGAPASMRTSLSRGQLTAGQMIDRYDIACRPVRDLLVDYLRERQPSVDYDTLRNLAQRLGSVFWRDLELHHPGIDSLHLPPHVAAEWKQRTMTTTVAGEKQTRATGLEVLTVVRAFYLDIAEWALEDPAQWGPWAAPCPVRGDELSRRKELSQRKARMDQRTRERLPVLPALVASADAQRRASRERLEAAAAAEPGQAFTAGGQALRRSVLAIGSRNVRIWADDPGTGKRRDLTLEEHRGFWAWTVVEVLRHTGIRAEELTELSHHSLVQYSVPSTGELIPLLHIAPSKTDQERLLVVSPELADVLSAIISRIRDQSGAVPLVISFDAHEKTWNPPMPLLLQRRLGTENRPIGTDAVRDLLNSALTHAGLTDPSGRPLTFQPHDFRRLFITDAVMNGMPPHIAQLVVGHRDVNTTMGYKAVYPEEVINGHRAFITRRRATRPGEEYRTPSDEEWEEFLGHFERRKVALGECGRAYSSPCIHEHSCIRCPLLRVSPGQRPRLEEIRDNLNARIAEAQREGWLGEAEGLKVSLAAAEAKLAQVDGLIARRREAVSLGMPSFPEIADRTASSAKEPE
ncbi:MAG: tyrosine-type recombinase/integrase [Trebonia sp.]